MTKSNNKCFTHKWYFISVKKKYIYILYMDGWKDESLFLSALIFTQFLDNQFSVAPLLERKSIKTIIARFVIIIYEPNKIWYLIDIFVRLVTTLLKQCPLLTDCIASVATAKPTKMMSIILSIYGNSKMAALWVWTKFHKSVISAICFWEIWTPNFA